VGINYHCESNDINSRDSLNSPQTEYNKSDLHRLAKFRPEIRSSWTSLEESKDWRGSFEFSKYLEDSNAKDTSDGEDDETLASSTLEREKPIINDSDATTTPNTTTTISKISPNITDTFVNLEVPSIDEQELSSSISSPYTSSEHRDSNSLASPNPTFRKRLSTTDEFSATPLLSDTSFSIELFPINTKTSSVLSSLGPNVLSPKKGMITLEQVINGLWQDERAIKTLESLPSVQNGTKVWVMLSIIFFIFSFFFFNSIFFLGL